MHHDAMAIGEIGLSLKIAFFFLLFLVVILSDEYQWSSLLVILPSTVMLH